LLNFSMKVLERLPLCEMIIPEKSYLNILVTKIWTISDLWFF
jgi:hypothetical protein